MFDKLKKNIGKKKDVLKTEEVYFKLAFDDRGAYVEVVDSKGQEQYEVVASQQDVNTREVLKCIEHIREGNLFSISWDNVPDRIYLDTNFHLLELLKHSKYLVNEKMEIIEFVDSEEKTLTLKIEETDEEGKKLRSSLLLEGKSHEYKFLNDGIVLCDTKIYRIKNIGESYMEAGDLNSEFPKEELESFLTVSLSYFLNLEIEYRDYRVVFDKERELKPQIIIEKISRDNSLYLNIGLTLSTLSYEFLSEYDINRAAIVNDMENKISICDVNLHKIGQAIEEVVKLLTKLQRRLKLREGYYLDGNLIILQEKLAKEFITKELLQMVGKYKIVGTDKLKKYKIRTVKPKLVTNLQHSIDFLEGDVELDIDGEKFSIFDVLASYKKDSYIVLSDGTNALINKKYIEKLERLFKKKDDKAKVSFFDLPLVEDLIDDKVLLGEMNKSKDVFRGLNDLAIYEGEKPPVKATLREYQDYGYRWLSYLLENQLGGCLADDMGLGKTLQAIAILSKVHSTSNLPSLVAMPKSLVYNWDNEIKKFSPNLNVKIYYGNNRDINEIEGADVVLTTYGTVRNDIKLLKDIEFEMVILDESQNIKNVNSQTTKAVMLLNSRNRIALSGTPVENNLGELYSLFRFLNPTMFGGIEEFNTFYANPIQRDNDQEVIEELKKKIYPFILRRTKREVLKDLPDKIEKTLFLEMNEKQKKLYDERRMFYYDLIHNQIKEHGIGRSQIFILQALNELRQIASCPEMKSSDMVSSIKREVLIEQIKDAVDNGHKILVFTNFIKSIDNICEDLNKAGIKHISMTGGTKDRQSLVEKFQNDKKCKVFVMTLKTGGVGLNLTAADTIFIYDPWWNKTAEDQAVDRSHRMGQDRTVFSYKMITKGTIEEKILKLQEEKSRLFDNLISSDSATVKTLSEKDIEYILGE
ncbi:helicase SNF [Propionigenium maris DSM 9537]|uniref:Helicase SNF n=1 Tax=Propionigenium maris DSM 9537 TaxID=1123000 RepID=A0A9W6GLV0_9FUSO|nr:SNF2-related protein [Propionigenium maris]GLI55947.1 helicase SNF [Propionigenium maris DSM 9537]